MQSPSGSQHQSVVSVSHSGHSKSHSQSQSAKSLTKITLCLQISSARATLCSESLVYSLVISSLHTLVIRVWNIARHSLLQWHSRAAGPSESHACIVVQWDSREKVAWHRKGFCSVAHGGADVHKGALVPRSRLCLCSCGWVTRLWRRGGKFASMQGTWELRSQLAAVNKPPGSHCFINPQSHKHIYKHLYAYSHANPSFLSVPSKQMGVFRFHNSFAYFSESVYLHH